MKKILITTMFFIIILFALITPCFGMIDPDVFKEEIYVDTGLAEQLGGVIGIVQIIGVGIVAIACVIMGIRYVMSSVEEKADIKKKVTPYVIGALIFFGATGVLQIISQMAMWLTGD